MRNQAETSWPRRAGRRIARRFEAFAEFTVDVIYDRRRKGPGVKAYALFLKALSHLFSGIVQARYWLYQKRILHNRHLGCLVVVVGNLTVGGTGKTPVVERLARSLRERGRKVAILSRGYKSKKEFILKRWLRRLSHLEPPPPKVVSDGENVLLNAEVAGDEPYMLAKNLPGVLVLVDKDRVKAGVYAIKRFGADTLILDDGFQYFALKDHMQLLMIDKNNPFGNGSLLPRGILREPVRRLKRASYIFFTKSAGQPDLALEARVRRHKPGTEIIECAHRAQYLQEVNGPGHLDLTALKGKRVGAFSAIAAPESFELYISRLGASLEFRRRYIDHHWYDYEELESLFAKAFREGAEMVVTTEKDAVRIPEDFRPALPFYYLRVEIGIISGAKDFEEAVSRICFPEHKTAAK